MKRKFNVAITFNFETEIDESDLAEMAEGANFDPEDFDPEEVLTQTISDDPGEFIDTFGDWESESVTVKELR